jgi:ADP-dependent phosphofructokinase/glucokinase
LVAFSVSRQAFRPNNTEKERRFSKSLIFRSYFASKNAACGNVKRRTRGLQSPHAAFSISLCQVAFFAIFVKKNALPEQPIEKIIIFASA